MNIHVRDRKGNNGPNRPFGQGDTPIADVLGSSGTTAIDSLLSRIRVWVVPAVSGRSQDLFRLLQARARVMTAMTPSFAPCGACSERARSRPYRAHATRLRWMRGRNGAGGRFEVPTTTCSLVCARAWPCHGLLDARTHCRLKAPPWRSTAPSTCSTIVISIASSLTRATMGAANLSQSPLVGTDEDGNMIGPLVKAGLPNLQTAMPSYAELTSEEIVDLARYIHFLRQQARFRELSRLADTPAGDRTAGEAYFNGAANCRSCHSVTGDLAGIGRKYDTPTLRAPPQTRSHDAERRREPDGGSGRAPQAARNYTAANVQDLVAYLGATPQPHANRSGCWLRSVRRFCSLPCRRRPRSPRLFGRSQIGHVDAHVLEEPAFEVDRCEDDAEEDAAARGSPS